LVNVQQREGACGCNAASGSTPRWTAPVEFLLSIHAAKSSRQRFNEERFVLDPHEPVTLDVEPLSANRGAAFRVVAARITVTDAAPGEIEYRIVNPLDVEFESPAALPVATWHYLRPSRYCQADLRWNNPGSYLAACVARSRRLSARFVPARRRSSSTRPTTRQPDSPGRPAPSSRYRPRVEVGR
jgi:hypothetical protein